jgi:dethiobiotin synthetase
MIGYFVTGTDTGVGKTHITCALARYARARDRRVFAFKPIETGYGEGLSDEQRLADASGSIPIGGARFRRPVAPSVAARVESMMLDLQPLAARARDGARDADLVLVEGAGGWRVPVGEQADMGTLAKLVQLPIIVVARATLGTINHALLTIEAITRDECSIAALVMSRKPDDDRAFALENLAEISRCWHGRTILYENDDAVLAPLVTDGAT